MSHSEPKNSNSWQLIFFAWLVAAIATIGSLYFSEVMGYIPCALCWYQRIFMYPLVILLFIGSQKLDKSVIHFVSPLVILGWLFALYHNLLHWKIIPESASPCREGIPCTALWINWYGFITIPFLSLIAFSVIAVLLYLYHQQFKKSIEVL